MTPPTDPKFPGWVQDFLASAGFKDAVDAQVKGLKDTVNGLLASPGFQNAVNTQVADLRATVTKLKSDAERAVVPEWATPMPITGLKTEIAGLNLALNGVKAELNLFDPVKLFGIQDRVDRFFLDMKLRRQEKEYTAEDLDPEQLLMKIREVENDAATKKSVSAMQEQVSGAHSEINALQTLLNTEPDLPDVRKKIVKLEKNYAWAKGRIDQLSGSRDPQTDQTRTRRRPTDLPSVRQLERQEKQLRETMVNFVRLVRGATPDMQAFSGQIEKIERDLKR